LRLSIVEILLVLIVALIVIPPDHLPEVMRTVGKILRELRLASNTVVRELSGVLEEPPYMHQPPPLPPRPDSEAGSSDGAEASTAGPVDQP
jgi:Sec-independent protein translocase protein TatA